MDLSKSRVQHIQESPSLYYIPFSSPHPLFHIIGSRIFTLFVDYRRVTGSTGMCNDQLFTGHAQQVCSLEVFLSSIWQRPMFLLQGSIDIQRLRSRKPEKQVRMSPVHSQ